MTSMNRLRFWRPTQRGLNSCCRQTIVIAAYSILVWVTLHISYTAVVRFSSRKQHIKHDISHPRRSPDENVLPLEELRPTHVFNPPKNSWTVSSSPSKRPTQDVKMLLLWTGLTLNRPNWRFDKWSFHKCPMKNCNVTNDRSQLKYADAVLFRLRMLAPDLTKEPLREFLMMYDVKDLPSFHMENQIWIEVNQESPMYSHSDSELIPLNGKIDLIASYRKDSDFTYSYMMKHRLKETPSKSINYATGKTKMALWFVSHCDALSGRWKYVEELQKYGITVDIFGGCTGKSDGCLRQNISCLHELRSTYKFYLALENSICSEYITEKFWQTLNDGSYNIPIALGASLSEYEKYAPPNSYIHVRNFTGAKDLAAYMLKLDQDDELYNRYHTWREKYEMYQPTHEPLNCWLCRMANEKPKIHEQRIHSEYWSRKKLCEQENEPI